MLVFPSLDVRQIARITQLRFLASKIPTKCRCDGENALGACPRKNVGEGLQPSDRLKVGDDARTVALLGAAMAWQGWSFHLR